jgi:hypothetical protein
MISKSNWHKDYKDYIAFCQKVKTIPFASIAQSLRQTQGWTKHQIARAIARYINLLFLVKCYPNEHFIPDQETDEVLHAHLAFKQQFNQDCLALFNVHLEHESGYGSKNQADRCRWEKAFDRTQTLIEQYFGAAAVSQFAPAYCVLKITATRSSNCENSDRNEFTQPVLEG